MIRTLWIKRKFHFKIPPGWLPNIIVRLQGTRVRLREVTATVSEHISSIKYLEKWSIREHIGLLTDLETLHMGRINDFVFRQPELRAADMTNLKTHQALHNLKPVPALIAEFVEERNHFILHLEILDDETMQFVALHPRLKTYMRPVDLAFFTAEHDDHHLASIRMIMKTTRNKLLPIIFII